MKNKLFCFLLSIAALATALYGAEPTIPENEKNAVEKVASIIQHLQQAGNTVWEGYDLTETPLLITFSSGHLFAFNLKNPSDKWLPFPSHSDQNIQYSEQDHWNATKVQMHPKLPVDGEFAFVFKMDLMQDSSYLPFFVLIHERFHHFQFQAFAPPGRSKRIYQDHLNPENLLLMQLEDRLLTEFIETTETTSEGLFRKKELLKDFVAVNTTRQELMKPSSIAWERDQQKMEGLADYVSIKTFNSFPLDDHRKGTTHLLKTLYAINDNLNVADRSIKSRHYSIGASLGLALDFLSVPHWKRLIENGIGLDQILSSSLRLTSQEIKERVAKIRENAEFKKIKVQTQSALESYQNDLKACMEGYQKVDGVTLYLSNPRSQGMSGGGLDQKTYHLGDGSTLSIGNSSTHHSQKNNWNLSLKEVPYLFQKTGGIKEFKINKETKLVLNNNSYQLKELLKKDQEENFLSISLKGENCEFKSVDNQGKLKIKDGKVYIIF